MIALFGVLAVWAGSIAPPPGAPIPLRPAPLAGRLAETERALADAVAAWSTAASPRPPLDVTLDALYEQRILIVLSERPRVAAAVFRRLPPLYRGRVRRGVLARRGLGRLSRAGAMREY